MKRIAVIFFSLFYALMVSGISLDFHYCGNKLQSVHLPHDNHDEDDCCGSKEKSKRCCTNKTAFFNLNEKHEAALQASVPDNTCKQIAELFSFVPETFITVCQGFPLKVNHSPPLTYNCRKTPLFLLNRVLLI